MRMKLETLKAWRGEELHPEVRVAAIERAKESLGGMEAAREAKVLVQIQRSTAAMGYDVILSWNTGNPLMPRERRAIFISDGELFERELKRRRRR